MIDSVFDPYPPYGNSRAWKYGYLWNAKLDNANCSENMHSGVTRYRNYSIFGVFEKLRFPLKKLAKTGYL